MIPDFDHDGDIDTRDYYDDLGGAYHFAPKELGVDKKSCLQNTTLIVRIVAGLFWICILLIALYILK